MNDTIRLYEILLPYINHRPLCSINGSFSDPSSDFCDCGITGALAKVKDIIRRQNGNKETS